MAAWVLVLTVLWLRNCKSYGTVKRRDFGGTWMGSYGITSST
jgi:hypothetical protein